MNIRYCADYIRTALSSDEPLAPVDSSKANGYSEQLTALLFAHKAGGARGAYKVWLEFKAHNPELERIVRMSEEFIPADELKYLKMPAYLLQDYPLYTGAFNAIVGASGHGKSFVALDIAAKVSLQSPAVYIAGEGISGYSARWEAWRDYHQVTNNRLTFYTRALQVMDLAEMAMFIDVLRVNKPEVVVVDTLARSAVGLDENSAKDMGQFIAACDYLRHELECSLIIVHHTGKSGEIRGSTALYGAADAVLSVAKVDGLIRVSNSQLWGGKSKYHEDNYTSYFKLTPHEANGFEGAILAPAEKLEDLAGKLSELQLSLLSVLADRNRTTVKDAIRATGGARSTVYNNLKKLVEVGAAELDNVFYVITEKGLEALELLGADQEEEES